MMERSTFGLVSKDFGESLDGTNVTHAGCIALNLERISDLLIGQLFKVRNARISWSNGSICAMACVKRSESSAFIAAWLGEVK